MRVELSESPRTKLAAAIGFPRTTEKPPGTRDAAEGFSETKPMRAAVGNPIRREYGSTRAVREESEELLRDSCETAERAGDVGAATFERLVVQRSALAGATRDARSMRRVTADTNRSLAAIGWAAVQRQACLSLVIAALALIDAWLLYLLVKHGGNFKGR